MVAPDAASIVKREVEAAVMRARSIDRAAHLLAEVFQRVYPNLIRLAVRIYDPTDNTVRVAGVWSDTDTSIGPGFSMAAAATSIPEVLRTGRPVFEEDAGAEYLEDVLRAEGIRSWVSVPLKSGGGIRGLFSLSGREKNAFPREDEHFLVEVGGLLEERLLELAAEDEERRRGPKPR